MGATLLILGTYSIRNPLLVKAARFLTVNDVAGPADYLVVLGGGLETRPFTAARLYHQGVAPAILLFEHSNSLTSDVPGVDDLHIGVLESQGVSRGAVQLVPGTVASSLDEARSLRRFLTKNPASRIVLVTSPEHGRRARNTFRSVLHDRSIDIRVAASYHPTFDETNWWVKNEGVLTYLHEFIKLPLYWARRVFGHKNGSEDAVAFN